MIYLADERRVTAIDFDSRAPLGFRPELFADPEQANHGYLAVGVPGVVAGFDLALKKYGKLPRNTVAEHAVGVAEQGFRIEPGLQSGFRAFAA